MSEKPNPCDGCLELLDYIDEAKLAAEPSGYVMTGKPLPLIVREIVSELLDLRGEARQAGSAQVLPSSGE